MADYFLLLGASFLSGKKIKEIRLILVSFAASFTSLYIFVSNINFILDICIRLSFAVLITFAAFGFKNIKVYFKCFFSFVAVSVIYNGIAVFIWTVFKPMSMVINNSVVYFNISVLEMILFSAVGYVLIRVAAFFIRYFTPSAKYVNIRITNGTNVVDTFALVDTGNSLCDIYCGRKVIITDHDTADKIFGNLNEKLPLLLPYVSVSGNSFIKAYQCDSVNICGKIFTEILIAVSDINLDGNYKAIINPAVLEE